MWLGKSLIPKPRLSTPRRADRTPNPLFTPTSGSRTPSRTPSRIPRPPSRFSEETTANHAAAPKPVPTATAHHSNQMYHHNMHMSQPSTKPGRQMNPLTKRGDMLAEHVIASGIISSDSPHQKTQSNYSNYANDTFNSIRPSQLSGDESQLAKYGISHEASRADSILPSPNTCFQTPPRKLKSSHFPRSDLSNPTFGFSTPERKTRSGKVHQSDSTEELVIDEELVTRTPAKHKNREWLASFGIDVSLLKITDDDAENHDPNMTPSRGHRNHRFEMDESGANKSTTSRGFQRRRATDFYGYAQSAREPLAGPPTRMSSARKTRRASARISVRELDALKYNDDVEVVAKKVDNDDIPKGSDVFLTPIRATRKQREKNGTPVVLSEVRRSLRINTPSSKLVPKNSVRGRVELLEANDHSYIPNPTLRDRTSLSG